MSMFEKKTVDEIGTWLIDQGFSHEVVENFAEQGMDGEAILIAFTTNVGADCLRDVLPKLGIRLKVYNALRKELMLMTEVKSPPPSPPILERIPSSAEFSLVATPVNSPPPSPPTLERIPSSAEFSLVAMPRKNVPWPFPIPTFRLATENNLERKVLTDKDRKYIVRTLSTILMTYVQKPTIHDCEIAATSLVERWDFLADGEGDGQHSWMWFIYSRCQNTNRPSFTGSIVADGPIRKRIKLDKTNKHAYPSIPPATDDDVSNKHNLDLLNEEIRRSKPRPEVLKDLMYQTFPRRRKAMLQGSFQSASDVIGDYPLLKKSSFIAHEFGLVVQQPDVRDGFKENFLDWSKAVINYCRESQVNNYAVQTMLSKEKDEDLAMVALRCLGVIFCPLKKKPTGNDIPFILKVVPHGTPTSVAIDLTNKQPYIVLFAAEDDDLNNQFFIVVEGDFILECNNPVTAVFNLMASHYVFNLDYHPKAKNALTFIQEKVLKLPETPSRKSKSPTAIAHTAGIIRYYEDL